MCKRLDLYGKEFGRLKVISKVDKRPGTWWECNCSCGNVKVIRGGDLSAGHTRSCGCLLREKSAERIAKYGGRKPKHGHASALTPTYKIWRGMRARCNNPNMTGYGDYGGRGIQVCARWDSFESFLEDMGDRPDGHQLDRINNNGNYEPSNCRWVTPKINNRNTRQTRFVTAFGKTRCVKEWSEITGINHVTLYKRLDAGWPVEKALTTGPWGKNEKITAPFSAV